MSLALSKSICNTISVLGDVNGQKIFVNGPRWGQRGHLSSPSSCQWPEGRSSDYGQSFKVWSYQSHIKGYESHMSGRSFISAFREFSQLEINSTLNYCSHLTRFIELWTSIMMNDNIFILRFLYNRYLGGSSWSAKWHRSHEWQAIARCRLLCGVHVDL